jgi:hypothetical protein
MSHCYFVHNVSLAACDENETGCPRWKGSNYLSELWHAKPRTYSGCSWQYVVKQNHNKDIPSRNKLLATAWCMQMHRSCYHSPLYKLIDPSCTTEKTVTRGLKNVERCPVNPSANTWFLTIINSRWNPRTTSTIHPKTSSDNSAHVLPNFTQKILWTARFVTPRKEKPVLVPQRSWDSSVSVVTTIR